MTVLDGTTAIGTATVAADGSWTTSVTLAGDGPHSLTATDTDAAGNTGTSAPITYTLDTVAPTVAIGSTGGVTTTPGQTISGTVTGEAPVAGTTVTVLDGTTAIGTATVAADGSWTTSVTLTGDGPHSLTATDTDAAGNTGTSGATLYTLHSQAPVASNSGPAATYVSGSAAVPIAPSLVVSDADSTILQSASVSISSGFLAGDMLSFASQAGISGSYNAANGTLTLSGAASLAAYQAVLSSIAFGSTAADPTAGNTDVTRTITVVLNDGVLGSTALAVPVVVHRAPGVTYHLATGADTIAAGAGDDVFIATAGTIGAKDSIDGGAGSNTLNLVGGGTFNLALPITLANIQIVNLAEGLRASGTVASTHQRVTLRSGLDAQIYVASLAGGGGSIRIIGAAGDSSTLHLGVGTDTVTLGSATESIVGGGGTAVIQATAATAGALINATGGTTTLEISGGGTVTLNPADTGITTVKLLGTAPYQLTLNGEAGLVVDDRNGGDDTIVLGAAGQSVLGGSGTLTIEATAATAGDLVSAGSGRATITVAGGGTFALNSGDSRVTALDLAAAGTAYAVSVGTEANLAITDNSATADSFTLGAATQTLFAGAGADTVHADAAGAAALIKGGSGGVSLDIAGGGTVRLNSGDSGITAVNLAASTTAYATTLYAGFAGTVTDNSTSADRFTGAADRAVFDLGQGTDTVTLGSAAETVQTGAGSATIDATAATAGALIEGAARATLAVSGGGTIALDAADSGVKAITLAASGTAYSLTTGSEAGLAITDASRAGDLIDIGGINASVTDGAGADTIHFHAGMGQALVTGFTATGASHDTLEIDRSVFADWAHLIGATRQVNGDLVITIDANDSIRLANVSLHAFTASDVKFV